jgi:hypothetical protein
MEMHPVVMSSFSHSGGRVGNRQVKDGFRETKK